MHKVFFGSEVAPSRVCLGTGGFGTLVSRTESFAALDAFVAAGGNFLDTAHVYADWVPGGAGVSERTIGEWLRVRRIRNKIIIRTKGGHPPLGTTGPGHCARAYLERDLDESLDRLGVDCIDLYWLHRDEPERPVGEIVETLAGFVKAGQIRSYGASNWTAARMEAANVYASAHRLPPFVADQPRWALAVPPPGLVLDPTMVSMDENLRKWHIAGRSPCVPYSAQAGGYFGEENVRWARGGFSGKPLRGAGYDSPANRVRLLGAMQLAALKGCTPNQIGLAYLMNQPFPVFPIIGSGNPEHIREAMAATAVRLSQLESDDLRGG